MGTALQMKEVWSRTHRNLTDRSQALRAVWLARRQHLLEQLDRADGELKLFGERADELAKRCSGVARERAARLAEKATALRSKLR